MEKVDTKNVKAAEVKAAEVKAVNTTALTDEQKAKKAASAKAWLENKKKENEKRVALTQELIEKLKKLNVYDKLDSNMQQLLNGIAFPTTGRVAGTSVFSQLFGENPTVGTSVTLRDVFDKTLKGKAEISHYTKLWLEKGIQVVFEENAASPVESKFVLKSLNYKSVEAKPAEAKPAETKPSNK